MSRVLLAALCLVSLAGCAAKPSPPAAPALPPRPQEIPVLGLDPCALPPSSLLAELRMERPGRVVEPPRQAPPGTQACSWTRSILERPSAGVSVGVLPQNATAYLGESGAEQTAVAGFPAVQLPNDWAGAKQSCELLIDVAPGQALLVSYYNTLGDEVGATHALMCERARRAAEGVMQQLLATRR